MAKPKDSPTVEETTPRSAATATRSRRTVEQTRRAIINAATAEFTRRGFDGTVIAAVARRAKVSKQLLHYHFSTKDDLFRAVRAVHFRPAGDWSEPLPADLFAERFERRAKDLPYIKFLIWEAVSGRDRTLPGESERQMRLSRYGADIKRLQEAGRIPPELDTEMLQLAILSLATYPVAFSQVTRLVTGTKGTDPKFQARWAAFLKDLGRRLLG